VRRVTVSTIHTQTVRQSLRIVVDTSRPIIRPIQLAGLDEVLRLYRTVEEALAAGT
jgi:anti-sigma B factor antagonist